MPRAVPTPSARRRYSQQRHSCPLRSQPVPAPRGTVDQRLAQLETFRLANISPSLGGRRMSSTPAANAAVARIGILNFEHPFSSEAEYQAGPASSHRAAKFLVEDRALPVGSLRALHRP